MPDTPAPVVVHLSERDRTLIARCAVMIAFAARPSLPTVSLPPDADDHARIEAILAWERQEITRLLAAGDPPAAAATDSSSAEG